MACSRSLVVMLMDGHLARLIDARTISRQWSKAKHDASVTPKICAECGSVFVAEYGTKLRQFCSLDCGIRNQRRRDRLNKKARLKRVECESFNPIDVLERDGWRCYICGVDTPRVLRGTFEPNAPELEHIIAIANGGSHTKDNTACACRQCNGLKSDNDNVPQIKVAA